MRIKDIRASVHTISITIPLLTEKVRGFGREEQREFVFCEVETDDGLTGVAVTGHFLAHSVASALEQYFLPTVRDMDVRDVEAVHARVWQALNPRAMTGVVSSALSLLDIAMWDIHGKAVERPVARMLGGARDEVECYVTFGFSQYDREQLAAAARLHLDNGFTGLKLIVGADPGGWREDAARIRAVRDEVGDGVDIMIDANYLFRPVDALRLCRAIADYDIAWFEEPLHQNDARAMADLRSRTSIPFAAGQMEGHRWRLRELIEQKAVDVIQPNVCYGGGYTEVRKTAHLAQIYNLPIANGGGWPLFNLHTMAGLMNGWLVEWHLGMVQVGELLFPDSPRPVDGKIAVPDRPGLGLTVDREALRASRVQTD